LVNVLSYKLSNTTGRKCPNLSGGNSRTDSGIVLQKSWVKPQGASFVWFTLIGGGGGGGGSMRDSTAGGYSGGGGASGNVTNFMCPAFFLPDDLSIQVGLGGNGGLNGGTDNAANDGLAGNNTRVYYKTKNGFYQLLVASGGGGGKGANFGQGNGGIGQSADAGGPMTAAGFYNATDGQSGKNGAQTATVNNLTFVMGGGGRTYLSDPYQINGYYGYVANQNSGYSQISPIIMSIAGSSYGTDSQKQKAAPFGCGGNGGGNSSEVTDGCRGGDGLAIIVTW